MSYTSALMQYKPHFIANIDPSKPRRKSMVAPTDNNTFVKPIRQCFVKNPRMMPMTRMMLTLLAGWSGAGGSIETTTGIIGKHLSRCRRQVFRYLKDAVEEGYLSYTRTKDRIGRYTGIKLWLNFSAIRFEANKKSNGKQKNAETLDVTQKSETNSKYIYKPIKDDELHDALARLASLQGFELDDLSPS